MERKLFTLALALCAVVTVANAQLKMNSNGKMLLGPPYSTQDPNNVLAGSVFGPGSYGGGGKLAFGDFGQYANWGWNVFVGEYTDDGATDQLWLHGKWGIYLTTGGKAQYIVGRCQGYSSSAPTDFYFNTNVWANGIKLSSDARYKTNVNNIQTPLTKLLALEGVTYNFSNQITQDILQKQQEEKMILTNTEKNDGENIKSTKIEPMPLKNNNKHIGFIAQDLQKVFPDLVSTDDLGFLGIDYIGLIPVIVEAMKEQQNIMDAQSAKIKELEKELSLLKYPNDPLQPIKTKQETGIENNALPLDGNNTFLYQNVPNPFTETTEIRYFLPENASNAKLYIFNVQGQNVKTLDLQGKGMGSVTIKGAELAPGAYTYMLYANGTELDVKRMILTK